MISHPPKRGSVSSWEYFGRLGGITGVLGLELSGMWGLGLGGGFWETLGLNLAAMRGVQKPVKKPSKNRQKTIKKPLIIYY